ncbi:DUF484 family protein [Saccharophagus degradans]|uniref:Phytochrome sensor protein n=1 Tax=Saccharophagus degradans (strain 2-40 / ATCC 43961 / DSM 17024) TaxID=203122 RepID=Q21P79_SACD2|nr:DUF484 family protein [Saccharophagus degradans]ABD79500.1 protein of unknown function DUF484 [Saccharophagus degradans 2-40]
MSNRDASITDQRVAEYLAENPDFFVKHSRLLGELELPHDSGKAVSLVERQVSVLRDRNMDMRQRLSNLLDNARENDRLFEKSKRLVLALLECNDLGDLVDALYYSFDKEFNIQHTRLIIFGNHQTVPSTAARIENLHVARDVIGRRIKSPKAVSGGIKDDECKFLFDKDAPHIGSAAMSVLIHSKPLGVLAIGNEDPKFYHSGMGTIFLGYIAEVLNRLLPKYIKNY